MIMGTFDPGLFHNNGYCVTHVSPAFADMALAIMKAQTYSLEVYNEPNQYSKSWVDHDYSNPPVYAENREVLKIAFETLATDPYFSFITKRYGEFTKKTAIGLKYGKGNALGWHYDIDDPALVLMFLYISEDRFTKDDGGQLRLGRCHVDKDGIPDLRTVRTLEEITPLHGRLVVLDNTRPTLLHKVNRIMSEKNRYVISGKLGWTR